MPLPKIATPTYELELLSTGKTVKYRPFLVKEEKVLLIAMESEDVKQITNALKQVLKSCILTRGIKVEELPTFDIEYLFLNIRGKSVGEEIEVNLIAPDDGETSVSVTINVEDIGIERSENHEKTIKLDSNLRMEMKYPSLDEFIKNNFDFQEQTLEQSFDLIAGCVDKIYNEEEVWSSADCTKKDIIEFLGQMNSIQFKAVDEFFNTMPKLSHKVTFTNPNTGVENVVKLEGLASFFG
jgi:hypothetical protein